MVVNREPNAGELSNKAFASPAKHRMMTSPVKSKRNKKAGLKKRGTK